MDKQIIIFGNPVVYMHRTPYMTLAIYMDGSYRAKLRHGVAVVDNSGRLIKDLGFVDLVPLRMDIVGQSEREEADAAISRLKHYMEGK